VVDEESDEEDEKMELDEARPKPVPPKGVKVLAINGIY
jgi:hypothetical protein